MHQTISKVTDHHISSFSSSLQRFIKSDLFLYGLIVPVLPFALTDLLNISEDRIQSVTAGLLAAEALASVLFSPFAGLIADSGRSRLPFLFGLIAMSAVRNRLLLSSHSVKSSEPGPLGSYRTTDTSVKPGNCSALFRQDTLTSGSG